MRIPAPSSKPRVALTSAGAGRLPLLVILAGFVALRVFLSVRRGIVSEGDGLQEGLWLGRFWLGELTLAQLLDPYKAVAPFLRERTTQLLYPLLLSLQPVIGWSVPTHLLVLNTLLGVALVAASYAVARRVAGERCAIVVALLMCSMTGPYWIARMALVDNLFYAALPLFALSLLVWLREKTAKTLTLLIAATAALALSRPESFLVIGFVALVLVWEALRRRMSDRAAAAALAVGVAAFVIGTIAVVGLVPRVRESVLSRMNVSIGLAMSAETLFNRGQTEFDALVRRYGEASAEAERTPGSPPATYRISLEALATIKANPFWFIAKIPIRGLALVFPWTYQPWSVPHILYEAIYTIFLAAGVVLLVRRAALQTSVLVIGAIPLSILCFLSVFGVDNDLKHRNGVLVGLNLVAPLGYFLSSRDTGPAALDDRGAAAR
jgi:4-amino-4-deoxy-L-arabinose transferase-like glycosyltransferase